MTNLKALPQDIISEVKNAVGELDKAVTIIFVGKDGACETCEITENLADDFATLFPDKINVKKLKLGDEELKKYGIDKAPALAIETQDGDFRNIVFYGLPAGHELSSFIEAIKKMSTGKNAIPVSDTMKEKLKKIDKPVKIEVVVTPSCPYCPRAVILAHNFAYENPDYIRACMIEVYQFPEIGEKYNTSSVPQIRINENTETLGAIPENMLYDTIMQALSEN